MLMDQMMNMMEKFVMEIKEAEPEKRDHFVKISAAMFEISKELLAVSPEFRKGFAEVHSEFLKYPESGETINLGVESYKKYLQSK